MAPFSSTGDNSRKNDALERLRKGDPMAFNEFFDNNSGYVYDLLFRITGDRLASEETVSDVFLSMKKHLHKMTTEEYCKHYLRKTVVNAANYILRKKESKTVSLDTRIPVETFPELASDSPSTDAKVMTSQLLNYLYLLLKRVAGADGEVLMLSLVYEYTDEMIAGIRQTSLHNIQNQKSTGMKKLRKLCTREELRRFFLILSILAIENQHSIDIHPKCFPKIEKKLPKA